MATKKQRTHIAVLLDRSGSMNAIRADALGSYNAYLGEQQQSTADDVRWSLTLFGGRDVELRNAGVPLAEMLPMTDADYRPQGSTPLFDAMGQTMVSLEAGVKSTDRALFVIITDGHENASTEWSHAAVQSKVRELTDRGNWTIVYLASTPDAVEIGVALGLQRQNSVQLAQGGEADALRSLSNATLRYRHSEDRASGDFGATVVGTEAGEGEGSASGSKSSSESTSDSGSRTGSVST